MKNTIKYARITIVAFILTWATLLLPYSHTASVKDDQWVNAGLPISFATQNFTYLDPPLPWTLTFSPLSREAPIAISWIIFFLSWIIIDLFLILIYLIWPKPTTMSTNP